MVQMAGGPTPALAEIVSPTRACGRCPVSAREAYRLE